MTPAPPPPSAPVDRLFDVLADHTRRHVVEQLSTGPQRAGSLAEAASVSPPVMSRHLRILLEAGIVTDERSPADARVRVFRLRPDAIVPLQAWLDQLGAHWQEQLRSFKHHVESSEPS
jgi:DNA-binding transcriptional ArsR family regulator